VWNRAFWRPPTQAPADDTADAAAQDAGPELQPAAVAADAPGAADTDDGGADGSRPQGRQAARRAAWLRHTAVATATTPAEDGLDGEAAADGGRGRRRPLEPLPRVMVGSTAAMVVVTVALTVVAGPLYGIAERAAEDLRDRTPYITAVFGSEEAR